MNNSTLATAITLSLFCTSLQAAIPPAGSDLARPLETLNSERQATGSVNSDILDTSPCQASKRDYASYFLDLYESKEPLMNECGLGKLIDFDVLELFDPFGSILDSMRGAVCGLVKDIHDPFVTSLNREISATNAWMRQQERGYSDWVDEASRNAAGAIYDPTRHNPKVPWFNPSTGTWEDKSASEMIWDATTNSWVPFVDNYVALTTEEYEDRVIEDGGTVSTGTNVIGDDNIEILITPTTETNNEWDELYNVYQ